MTKKPVTVSVPGKIHLIGEHVVVHGRPAILAAIDKRCEVSVFETEDKTIEISSSDLHLSEKKSVKEVIEFSKKAEQVWQKFIDSSDVDLLISLTKKPLDYPFIAVGMVLRKLNIESDKGFTLSIDSRVPIGSGNGSSSAIAVSIVASVSKFLGEDLDKEEIFDIAFQIEKIKHGTPSGGDVAAVLYGGFTWFQNSDGVKTIKPLGVKMSDKTARNFYLINTGKPQESTGEMIAIVKKFMKENSSEAKKIFDDQEDSTRGLLSAIENDDEGLLIEVLKKAGKNLERLGVVSEKVIGLIRKIESEGGAAKISGGGGRKDGSGTVLVYVPSGKRIDSMLQSQSLQSFRVSLGTVGLSYDDSRE